jgi:Ca2+:H+ antiporter
VPCAHLFELTKAGRHAEAIAEKLGEPYGTLVLTLSVIVIEVSLLAAIMLHGQNNPTLARDAMFAATDLTT